MNVAKVAVPRSVSWWPAIVSIGPERECQEKYRGGSKRSTVQVLRRTTSVSGATALGIVAVFIAPVAEEMVFRGILYPAIKRAGYRRVALWSTSLIFAAMHMNVPSFVPLLVLAVLMVFIYERTNNLLSCIVAHSFFNATNFVSFYLFANK